jgi:hypothetical protein
MLDKILSKLPSRSQKAQTPIEPSSPLPRLTPEEMEARRHTTLAKLKAEMPRTMQTATKLAHSDSFMQMRTISDEGLLEEMQGFRRSALLAPEKVLETGGYGGVYSRSQLPEEHNKEIERRGKMLGAIEKAETPAKWGSAFNSELVEDVMITDLQLQRKLISYDVEMGRRAAVRKSEKMKSKATER